MLGHLRKICVFDSFGVVGHDVNFAVVFALSGIAIGCARFNLCMRLVLVGFLERDLVIRYKRSRDLFQKLIQI